MKYYFGRFLVILSIILSLSGIGLLIWCGVGQYIAQLNYDGQYITIRTIKDVSLWGYTGFIGIILAIPCFICGCNLQ